MPFWRRPPSQRQPLRQGTEFPLPDSPEQNDLHIGAPQMLGRAIGNRSLAALRGCVLDYVEPVDVGPFGRDGNVVQLHLAAEDFFDDLFHGQRLLREPLFAPLDVVLGPFAVGEPLDLNEVMPLVVQGQLPAGYWAFPAVSDNSTKTIVVQSKLEIGPTGNVTALVQVDGDDMLPGADFETFVIASTDQNRFKENQTLTVLPPDVISTPVLRVFVRK